MRNTKTWITSSVILTVFLFLCMPYASVCMARPPYCSDVCDRDSDCNRVCMDDNGETITCQQWGVCDSDPSRETSLTIEKAYPYAFPDPYGFGLRMEYQITLAKGHEAVSVTTQYSPDDGITWYTDEQSRSPKYD